MDSSERYGNNCKSFFSYFLCHWFSGRTSVTLRWTMSKCTLSVIDG